MPEFDHTTYILYRYLKELSVKISYGSIKRSLNTPMGNTLRGISDALDKFHIKHEVYQLPATYLEKLESPFIAVLPNGHFCMVKDIKEKKLTLISDKGKKSVLSLDFFLTIWKGTILIIDPSQKVQQESYYRIKQIAGYFNKYKCLIVLCLAGIIYLLTNHANRGEMLFNLMIWIGWMVSVGIIYKEYYNESFLQRFCKIGDVVDCNEILHSKAATGAGGIISLGEIALLYYSTLFLYTAFHDPQYITIWTLGTAIAVIFSVWSVVYQVFIAKKLCMLCTLLDIVIGVQAVIIVYSCKNSVSFELSWSSVALLLLVAGLCYAGWYSLKEIINTSYQALQLKEQKEAMLSYPDLLDILLHREVQIPNADTAITMHNERQDGKRIQIIINPHCKHCAKHHKEWLRLETPVNVLFSISDKNAQDRKVALAVISCYIKHGFQQAMYLLGEWFDRHDPNLIEQDPFAPQAEQILEAQQVYCKKIHLQHTPFITIDERKMPGIYTLEDLHYVL